MKSVGSVSQSKKADSVTSAEPSLTSFFFSTFLFSIKAWLKKFQEEIMDVKGHKNVCYVSDICKIYNLEKSVKLSPEILADYKLNDFTEGKITYCCLF